MRKATVNDKQLVIDILKKAFDDNKSVNYVVKQDQKRARTNKGIDGIFVRCLQCFW